MISSWIVVLRLVLATILGGIIGLEREVSNRPAGFRTHILVSIGSALIMLVSMDAFGGAADPSRIAAQVVSGIGFLGAGTIMRTGDNIKGLTTAASIWICGGIGLAIGSGYYLGGIFTTIIVFLSLISIGNLEKSLFKKAHGVFKIRGKTRAGLIGDIGSILGKHQIIIRDISMFLEEIDQEMEEIHIVVKLPHHTDRDKLFRDLYDIDGIYKLSLNDEHIKNVYK